MTIFDGYAYAAEKEASLKTRVAELAAQNKKIVIAAVLFVEDVGSQLYTRLKHEAAERVGIEYRVIEHRLTDSVEDIQESVEQLNADPAITGIIIQKPRRTTWVGVTRAIFSDKLAEQEAYQAWWRGLTGCIRAEKDVDGLRPETLSAIEDGSWAAQGLVLPATCKAVLDILQSAGVLPVAVDQPKVLVIGKSDILGLPLTFELQNQGCLVENVGTVGFRKLIASANGLKDFTVIVSATGVRKLVHDPSLLRSGVILIDVGEPSPDIDQSAVSSVAGFITPVPGGVGPVTVVSLLENAVKLANTYRSDELYAPEPMTPKLENHIAEVESGLQQGKVSKSFTSTEDFLADLKN